MSFVKHLTTELINFVTNCQESNVLNILYCVFIIYFVDIMIKCFYNTQVSYLFNNFRNIHLFSSTSLTMNRFQSNNIIIQHNVTYVQLSLLCNVPASYTKKCRYQFAISILKGKNYDKSYSKISYQIDTLIVSCL
jgi:hypothetical protein